MHDDASTEPTDGPATVIDRLVRAGLDRDRALEWIVSGGARVNDETTTDPSAPAPPPARVVLYSA